jgi:hypothetical protein
VVRSLILVVAVILGCSCAPRGVEPPSTPLLVAQTLASRGVPVGVILPRGTSTRGSPTSVRLNDAVPTVLARFNADNSEFAAEESDGVVHIRSGREPTFVAALLNGERTFTGPVTNTAWEALSVRIAGVLWAHGDELCCVGSLPEFPSDCPASNLVHLAVGRTTVLALLNSIVRQQPRLAWMVTYDPHETSAADDLQLSLLCPNGTGGTVCSGRAMRCGG